MSVLASQIDELYARIEELDERDAEPRAVVEEAIALLDAGAARVAEVGADGEVVVHEWLKRAVLLLFRLRGVTTTHAGPLEYADRLPVKHGFEAAGVRVVPGAVARWGSYLGPGVILMPSFVNVGAWVGAGTLVDTWATVGSCAQVGERVHLSGGVGIGGVLEPVNAVPVVIEDGALIGSRSLVVEGARVGRDAVVGSGTILTGSIPVIDAATGEELGRGRVPPDCVAVGASRRRDFPGGEFFLPCVLVVRRLEPGVRHEKAALNDVLRAHGVAT
ncbi:MAG TPA: 2,3,4,5-tetrahydropyridine-2,6-dicarboxylate N-succinyltransferase [Acidimicrobiales bacterium]|nr:2,3,4,5-tetrahydropyridine-2,6-dicarboxylate N-succinyltransferase [Acidimicrobiales bacterium]